ncbi:hypothetical protein SLEP1_g41160 [Rubroshorea leprosula]|uniref:Uncharacterized protein n=1 Tax=Rubroshorea leprosula TaxID=152421 RepID=A0AAV5L672_9ROSI|nr:hypothetical protein SLEP1_g41160 [Rubroshorea leprosula]
MQVNNVNTTSGSVWHPSELAAVFYALLQKDSLAPCSRGLFLNFCLSH